MTIALIVVVAVVVAAAMVAGIVVVTVRYLRQKSAAAREDVAELRAAMVRAGEIIVIEPEAGLYRGSSGHHGKLKGNGMILLTDQRLVFRMLVGGLIEVPRASIVGTRTAKSFLGARTGGQTHLVVVTADAGELGFFVTDMAKWQAALGGEQYGAT